MKKDNEMYFIFNEGYKDYVDSAISTYQLAQVLGRTKISVRASIERLKKRKEKDLVLKDKNGVKYSILTAKELNGGIWYK